jgi:chromosome segregation ATPase
MIESIMYFAGGFLVACLFALALISSVHHRAVRLTQHRLADSIPVSLNEIQADRDKLRARFAMSTRRLEVTVEQLQAKVTTQLSELARKSEAIARLKGQLAEKNAAADKLGARLRSPNGENREAKPRHDVPPAAAEVSAQALAAKDSELARAALETSELTFANETHRVEIVMLKTQIEQFRAKIDQFEREAREAKQRLLDEQVAVSNITKTLAERRDTDDARRTERVENEFLRERIADIAAQVAHLTMETGSPAATILRDHGARSASHERANGGDSGPTTLIERISKLHSASSRVTSAT